MKFDLTFAHCPALIKRHAPKKGWREMQNMLPVEINFRALRRRKSEMKKVGVGGGGGSGGGRFNFPRCLTRKMRAE